MQLDTYTQFALNTALPTALDYEYLAPALLAEVHELAAAVHSFDAKLVRDGNDKEAQLAANIVKELGDVAWPTAVILHLTRQAILDNGGNDHDVERAHAIDKTGAEADPLDEALRRAKLVADYLEFTEATALGQWLAYSEAWALWHHLRRWAEQISGRDLDHALEANVLKLADRKARGVLAGSGDNR